MRAGSREKEGLGARIHRRPQESIWPCGSGDHEGGMWRRKEEDGKVHFEAYYATNMAKREALQDITGVGWCGGIE